jgi:hypothetical protein
MAIPAEGDAGMSERPDWVVDYERTSEGSLVVVRRTDGSLAGFRMPSRSLRDFARSLPTKGENP